MLSDRAPAASNARTGCIWKAAPENILLTPAINADDRPHVMVMRHDHHMRTPDYVQDAQFIGSVKLPDSGALWLAGCIEQGCRLGDGPPYDIANGFRGTVHGARGPTVGDELLKVKHFNLPAASWNWQP